MRHQNPAEREQVRLVMSRPTDSQLETSEKESNSNRASWDIAELVALFEPAFHSNPGDLEGFISNLKSRITERAISERYTESCPVAGVSAEEYMPKLLRLSPNCSVVAMIHFFGLDVSKPFVEIALRTGKLPHSFNFIKAAFAPFNPGSVRVWLRPDEPAPDSARPDLDVLLGDIASIKASPIPSNYEHIELDPVPVDDCYDDYCHTFEAVFQKNPSAQQYASKEDRASLQKCFDSGGFVHVHVDGKPAGYLAARPETFRYWRGWHVIDEVLHPDFQGK